MKTAIDWAAKPAPWNWIGPAFRKEVDRIVSEHKAARSMRPQSGSPVDLGGGGDAALDGPAPSVVAADRRADRPNAGERHAKSQPDRGEAVRKIGRAAAKPERRADVVCAGPLSDKDIEEDAMKQIIAASRLSN